MYEQGGVRWNLFARELEDVLAGKGLRLTQLDDRVGIHPEKVRRLQKSLLSAKSFPTLNPNEMELLTDACQLTSDEIVRLRAAILATAVESLLMDRISKTEALRAAEQVFPIIKTALLDHLHESTGIGAFRKGDTSVDDSDMEQDVELEAALLALDHATMEWHLSYHVTLIPERLERAIQARDAFAAALRMLDHASPATKATREWSEWYDEAKQGHDAALERVTELTG